MAVEVFVVDDEPDVADVLREVLEGAGFGVSVFTSGTALLAEVGERRPRGPHSPICACRG